MPQEPDTVHVYPDDAACEIASHETVFRVVVRKDWITANDDGEIVLTSAAIPKDDLQNHGGRYLSLIRPDICDPISLTLRVVSISTKEENWLGDPVVGSAIVSDFDIIKDNNGITEVVIERKPLRDCKGDFLFHAGMYRNPPYPEAAQNSDVRLTWMMLRVAVAETFKSVTHLSGAKVEI